MSAAQTLSVAAIENGTVIDHIQPGQALPIVRLLQMAEHQKQITIGVNLKSRSMTLKDIIKIEDWDVSQEETNRIAVLSPTASVNIIRNYRVIKKFKIETPDKIEKIIVCPNPVCITNHEKMSTTFYIDRFEQISEFRCKYCERKFAGDEIQEYHSP